MYKLLGILTVAVFGVSITQAGTVVTNQPSVTAQPVVVEAKSQPSTSHLHRKAKLSPEQLSQLKEEKFIKLKGVKLAKLESFTKTVSTLEGKVSDKEEQKWFKIHRDCAERWKKAIREFKSIDTKLGRSIKFAMDESRMAQALAALKPTHQPSKAVYPEKDIEKLEARFNEIKEHAKDLTGDNQVAFQAMIDCATDYIKALKEMKDQPVLARRMLARAMKYVNTAQMFAVSRVAHH